MTSATSAAKAAPARANRTGSRDAFQRRAAPFVRWGIIVVALVSSVLPFYYMVMLSIRDLSSIIKEPGRLWATPQEWNLDSFVDVLKSVDSGGQGFLQLIGNSVLVALGTVALTLLLAVPGAYAVSRLKFFGQRQVSALFLGVYLFPTILLAVPLFVFFSKMGLRGALPVLIVVYVSQTIAVAIFMLRNYFDTVPVSIEEAAALDGLGRLAILRKIVVPLSLPSMLSTGLFVFMIAWNEFLFALLFLVENRERWTVSLGLGQLSNNLEIPPTALMAGSVVLTIPIIIIFFATERFLAGGLTAGAEK